MRAFRVFGLSLRDLYEDLYMFAGLNLLWWLCMIPALLVAVALVAIIVVPFLGIESLLTYIATAFVALAVNAPGIVGLMYLTNEVAHERRVEWRMFLTGARLLWWRSWLVGFVGLLGTVILISNIVFYVNIASGILQYLTILWIYLLIIWVVMQIYVFPLLVQMDQPRIFLIYRNALLLTLARPLFAILLILLLVIATVIGGVLTILLILAIPALWAIAANRALVYVLEEVRTAQSKAEGDEKGEEKD